MNLKKPIENYIRSKDGLHLYGFYRRWGRDKDNVLCVVMRNPRKKGFHPIFNRLTKLAKKYKYDGLRVCFFNTGVPKNNPEVAGRRVYADNNAKSVKILHQMITSSIAVAFWGVSNTLADIKKLEKYYNIATEQRIETYELWEEDFFDEDTLDVVSALRISKFSYQN